MAQDEPPLPIARDNERSSLCSLCGDVGFREALLPCRAAGCSRVQHTYCGRYRPEMMDDAGRWRCEWCAYRPSADEEEEGPSPRKRARRVAPRQPSPSPPPSSDGAGTIDMTEIPASSTAMTDDDDRVKISSSRAIDRWKSLAKKTRLGGKKYKLLADVLCFPETERTSTTPTA
ncbi:uncharacterized protein LOC144712734 [Wolffia australiana]